MKPIHRLQAQEDIGQPAKKRLRFCFDGKSYEGLEGDTLASALLANGVRVVGRSFKLHRPRGLFGAGVEEPNGLVQLESAGFDEPNARATTVRLYEGLRARSQNAWPNVRWDALGLLDRLQALLPASFYYKTMMWPNWAFYERWVRQLAGLGRAPSVPDAQNYQTHNLHCEILIVGAGPAGLQAALDAATGGARVVLLDEGDGLGGTLPGETAMLDGEDAAAWLQKTIERLSALPNVRLMPRTTASGYYENNFLTAAERVTPHLGPKAAGTLPRERLWRIHADEVILATGALERPLVFPDNDRPGVMLASAVRQYAHRHGVACGRRVVVAANNDSAYATVADLQRLGITVVALVDTRARVPVAPQALLARLGVRLFEGHAIRALRGRRGVRAVDVSECRGGVLAPASVRLSCDLVAMSSGWTPTVHLFSQAGGTLRYDEAQVCLVPDHVSQRLQVIGAANGCFMPDDCLAQGRRAAAVALGRLAGTDATSPVATTGLAAPETLAIEPFWCTPGVPTDRQWVDFQYDVKVSDIELAVRENFVSVEHVKRYTTGGMSIDQGKSSNFNILALIAVLTGRTIPEVGTTRFRPPYQPVTLGTLAGATLGPCYAPWQSLPAQAFHVRHRACFGDYGWKRPDAYPREGESLQAAIAREVSSVRNAVGMFDGSPLGKIEVKGPDAAEFLNRVYVNNIATLKPGGARYALLSNENGVLVDDGVIVRLSPEHFLVHATSHAVGRVALWFEECLQCDWPDLRVLTANVTTQWGNLTVSGPLAHRVMMGLDSDIDFSPRSFRHMQSRTGHVAGVRARVLRASFTGEPTYEISVPARYTQALWEHVARIGAPDGIVPYGIEALEVMRTEKGYVHIGSDTDGGTTALDLGWGAVVAKKQGDFIGRRSLQREADRCTDRLQFVGLEALDPRQALPVGGHLVASAQPTLPVASQGYVTSACLSPTLNRSIGLGLVRGGAQRLGEVIHVFAKNRTTAARIVAPGHFDPEGKRLDVEA